MTWKEKLITLATGKNKTERLQEKYANAEIRKKQNTAYYQAKEKESIRVAQARAKAEADSRVKAIQRRYNPPAQTSPAYNSPFGGGIGGPGGFSAITGARLTPQPQARPRVVYRDRPNKRTRRVRRVRRRTPRTPAQPQARPYSIWG